MPGEPVELGVAHENDRVHCFIGWNIYVDFGLRAGTYQFGCAQSR
jgi:hypothetical protein